MQNKSYKKYSGLNELLAAEKCRPNYNEFIVESCLSRIDNPSSCIDFGAGIGTLSQILKIKLGFSPTCIEIDQINIKYLNNRNLPFFKKIDDVKDKVDLVFSSNVLEHIEDDISTLKSINNKLNPDGIL